MNLEASLFIARYCLKIEKPKTMAEPNLLLALNALSL